MTQSILPPPGYRQPGGVASLVAPITALALTENTIISYVIPANSLAPGSTYAFDVYGNFTPAATTTFTWRLKMGATALAAPVTAATTATATRFHASGLIVCTTAGVSGKMAGALQIVNQLTGSATFAANAALPSDAPGINAGTFDTTIALTIALSIQAATAAATAFSALPATINLVKL